MLCGQIACKIGALKTLEIGVPVLWKLYDGNYYSWKYSGGPYVASGFGLNGERPFVIPKVGFALLPDNTGIVSVSGRLSYVHYTDFHKSQQCILPEISLSLFLIFSISYGYNFNLTVENFTSEKHVVTLAVIFPMYTIKKKKIQQEFPQNPSPSFK